MICFFFNDHLMAELFCLLSATRWASQEDDKETSSHMRSDIGKVILETSEWDNSEKLKKDRRTFYFCFVKENIKNDEVKLFSCSWAGMGRRGFHGNKGDLCHCVAQTQATFLCSRNMQNSPISILCGAMNLSIPFVASVFLPEPDKAEQQ